MAQAGSEAMMDDKGGTVTSGQDKPQAAIANVAPPGSGRPVTR